jgi:hypothetical protein
MKKILTTILTACALALPLLGGALDKPIEKVRIYGTIIQKIDAGLLVSCYQVGAPNGKKPFGIILLTGHPLEAKAFDGIDVKCVATDSGLYEYGSVTGAGRTVRSFAYAGK